MRGHGAGLSRSVGGQCTLPRARLLPALLGFNAGVEIGQLAVVVAVWPLLAALARWRRGAVHRLAMEVGSGAICALGVFWLVSRAYG